MTVTEPRHSIATSLAVWDIPTPAVAGKRFTIKIGAKASSNDDLRGHPVEVCDAGGVVIGEGRLGDTPWSGTEALYWAEVSLPAPASEGIVMLSARFQPAARDPLHGDAVARFSVAVARAPDHTLTIKVVTQETAAPIADAELRLGAYRATTDSDGVARLQVRKGSYELHMWRVGYQASPAIVAIDNNKTLEIKAMTMPEENADRAWKM